MPYNYSTPKEKRDNERRKFKAHFIDIESGKDKEEEAEESQLYCPNDSLLLDYRQDLDCYFCRECGEYFKEGDTTRSYTEEEIQKSKFEPTNTNNNANTPSSKLTTNRATIPQGKTFIRTDELNPIAIAPAGFNSRDRTDHSQEEAKRRAGYDKDLQTLEQRGATIIESYEVSSEDGTMSYYKREGNE